MPTVLHPNMKSHLFTLGSAMYYVMTGRETYEDVPDDKVTAKYKQEGFPDVEVLKGESKLANGWGNETLH